MAADLETLAAEVAELRARIDKPKKRKDRRPIMQCRLNDDEIALVDAAATARGVCRADLIRMGLNAVIGIELRIGREIPPGLRGRRNRKHIGRFSDEKTSVPLRDASAVRHLAARALGANIERHMAIAEAGGALAARPHNAQEGIGDSPSPLLSGKLSR